MRRIRHSFERPPDALMPPAQDQLEPGDDAFGVELPRHLADSPENLPIAISRYDQVGMPGGTLIDTPMTELTTPAFRLEDISTVEPCSGIPS